MADLVVAEAARRLTGPVGTYVACARFLTSQVGVGAIPPRSFYDDPADGAALVRFSFCQP